MPHERRSHDATVFGGISAFVTSTAPDRGSVHGCCDAITICEEPLSVPDGRRRPPKLNGYCSWTLIQQPGVGCWLHASVEFAGVPPNVIVVVRFEGVRAVADKMYLTILV